ncbi:MBL fold metallo-hydrolase [Halioxenophilus sp. WMMB6]|uniref:MBL fold metallo-hydrolase n=1 Tax=Halioxenophilus sp. WMMB6 TaxID=3073815 RepID=UPI00295E37C5|nr:MBL fold metallo-hydrolase [Halioxenophilus sp. WMMB6]
MTQKVQKLFEQDDHVCLFITGLVDGEGIPSNQFVVVDHGQAALFDPGGDLTYTPLSIELSKHIPLKSLSFIFASHQDPDIITSLPRWLMHTDCKVVSSKLWSRFLPHLVSGFVSGKMNKSLDQRLIELPDKGGSIRLGENPIKAVPAHFLHSVGNFHFYDPLSKILFSGDVGAAVTPGDDHIPVASFAEHLPRMEGFHRRYMASNRACRIWVERVRALDVEMLIPQHGKPFIGREMVNQFLNWFEQLECGIDLM